MPEPEVKVEDIAEELTEDEEIKDDEMITMDEELPEDEEFDVEESDEEEAAEDDADDQASDDAEDNEWSNGVDNLSGLIWYEFTRELSVPTDFAGEVVLFYFPEHSIAEKREKYKETAFCVIIPVHYEQVMNCEVFLQLW